MFKWDTLRIVAPHTLPYEYPINGVIVEVELQSGHVIRAFRSNDSSFCFCHGLTFGGAGAPGGPVSPFSGPDVLAILHNHFQRITPESNAIPGDVFVWHSPDGSTPHSAILVQPIVRPGEDFLDYASVLRSKNGRLPEAEITLEQLVEGPDGYGESYAVYRKT